MLSALARPTSAASTPASASAIVATGFFFAAMIPLNEGYRGSLIFSDTEITAGSAADRNVTPSSVSRPTCHVAALRR